MASVRGSQYAVPVNFVLLSLLGIVGVYALVASYREFTRKPPAKGVVCVQCGEHAEHWHIRKPCCGSCYRDINAW